MNMLFSSGMYLEFVGSLFEVSFWKIVIVINMVMFSLIFFLDFGGKIKERRIIIVIREYGIIRFIM